MSKQTAKPQRPRSVMSAFLARPVNTSAKDLLSITMPDLLRLSRREADAAVAELHQAGRLGTALALTNDEAHWLLEWVVAAWEGTLDGGLSTPKDVHDYELLKSILDKWQAGLAGIPRDGAASAE